MDVGTAFANTRARCCRRPRLHTARSSAPGRRRFGRGNSSSLWHALRRSTSQRSATGLGRRAASARIARPKSRARSSSVRSKPRGGKPGERCAARPRGRHAGRDQSRGASGRERGSGAAQPRYQGASRDPPRRRPLRRRRELNDVRPEPLRRTRQSRNPNPASMPRGSPADLGVATHDVVPARRAELRAACGRGSHVVG